MNIKLTTMKFKCIKENRLIINPLALLGWGEESGINTIEFPVKEFHERYKNYLKFKELMIALEKREREKQEKYLYELGELLKAGKFPNIEIEGEVPSLYPYKTKINMDVANGSDCSVNTIMDSERHVLKQIRCPKILVY